MVFRGKNVVFPVRTRDFRDVWRGWKTSQHRGTETQNKGRRGDFFVEMEEGTAVEFFMKTSQRREAEAQRGLVFCFLSFRFSRRLCASALRVFT